MLTAVVVVNEVIEKKNSTQLIQTLNNAGLKSVEASLWNRYLAQLITAKEEKSQVSLKNFYLYPKQLSADLIICLN